MTASRISVYIILLLSVFGFTSCVFDDEKVLKNTDFLQALSSNGLSFQSIPIGRHTELNIASDISGKREAYKVDDLPFVIIECESPTSVPQRKSDSNITIFRNENLVLISQKEVFHQFVSVFQSLKPPLSYKQTGIFKYPLALCLLIAIFIITERAYSLRRGLTFPRKVEKALISGEFPDKRWKKRSAAERIVYVAIHEKPSHEALLAYSRLEIAAMEKGLFMLEAVIAGAPLIGLLGTATGLVQVFSSMPSSGLSGGTEIFSDGIALALLTTMIGLGIAIPSLVGHAYLTRVVEKRAVSLDWLTTRLIDATHKNKSSYSVE